MLATAGLTATVGVLVGLLLAGSFVPSPAVSAVPGPARTEAGPPAAAGRVNPPAGQSFADVAERLNPAVVTIDASGRETGRWRQRSVPDEGLFGRPLDRERDLPRRGAGAGFLIDAAGHILTNHHVIGGADRIRVRLADGRSLRALPVGSDPETDIALIRVESPDPLPFAPLGDSDLLRVGEWVVAIGNPLAYEHTVTVGVVSFLGRKLFNSSLDRYIQTDAAINFGNSGGPLINAAGEVIGINAAISSRAANIGFAIPINQARAILPQLMETGRVSRGYIGVDPRDVDPDLQRSLGLTVGTGALVQDVRAGSPAARAGLRSYDVVVAVDGVPTAGSDDLIREISARRPGTVATLGVLRDGRPMHIPVKLAERPPAERQPADAGSADTAQPSARRSAALGLFVRDLDPDAARRLQVPDGLHGVLIARVEPMSPAFDAAIERNDVLLEINRRPVRSIDDYRRLTAGVQPGDVLALYVLKPAGRELVTVRVE